jgi:multidrug resistance efflux pump
MLTADGMVTQEKVVVASPYDARIRQVFVRPGDKVEAGQKIAVVESSQLSRQMAELSSHRARIQGDIAKLESRKQVVETLLPMSQAQIKLAETFLAEVKAAKARGLAVEKTVQEMTAAFLLSSERQLTLIGEKKSLDVEIQGSKEALKEVQLSLTNMQLMYEAGVLRAPVPGIVGTSVGSVGEVLAPGTSKVAQIHTGEAFVLAYLPDSYMFDVEEGQPVAVKARGQIITATIQKVLPVTETLPPEFQDPRKERIRGQMVRIEMEDRVKFAVDQKIEVTSCYLTGCKAGVASIVRKVGNSMLAWANDAVHQARVIDALVNGSKKTQ